MAAKDLASYVREADKMGMSYGQYSALLYAQAAQQARQKKCKKSKRSGKK